MAEDDWLTRAVTPTSDGDVGPVIREYRLASGQNQAMVAEGMGMTQQNLSQIEKGKRPVSLELRRKFSQVLGIPLDSLGLSPRPQSNVVPDNASAEVASSRGGWRAQRHWLNQHRSDLARLAAEWYPREHRVPDTPLLARPDWVPHEPVDLRDVDLMLDETPQSVQFTGREVETLPTRPLRASEVHFDSYTSVIKHIDPPRLFESRPSYRLLGGSLNECALRFGLAAYFDKLDISEALGHEMAIACMDRMPTSAAELRGELPFRERLGDPFDPQRRAIIPAITTLTIRLRRYPAEPSFLLHWRDPTKVATAAGIYDVIPAGEFQPSSVALWDRSNDFSLWRNIVREYSEELLGAPEHDGTRTEAIDYEGWDLYKVLSQAREQGKLTSFALGMGLDSQTLAATILTVVVIDDDTFVDAFGNAVQFNDEGEIVSVGDGRVTDGVPFTQEAVTRMLASEPMASPGAACLALAWKHRNHVIG